MTPRVDISREAVELLAASYEHEFGRRDGGVPATILALRDALDAAERQRDEALLKANAAYQNGILAAVDPASFFGWRAEASATGYARGVRDAAAIVRIAHEAATTDGEQDMAGEIHAAILALLPADVKETGDV